MSGDEDKKAEEKEVDSEEEEQRTGDAPIPNQTPTKFSTEWVSEKTVVDDEVIQTIIHMLKFFVFVLSPLQMLHMKHLVWSIMNCSVCITMMCVSSNI